MKADLIFAEIGSTTTVLTAFHLGGTPRIIAQSEHWTTVNEGDVFLGIERALKLMEEKVGEKITWEKFAATSSAAGGLKMTVHGLVYDMTVRAAREAALGAGAVIKYVTAGKMDNFHIQKVKSISPKLILLAGGVDYGESETVLHNAKLLAQMEFDVPIIYAGNIAVAEQIENILTESGKKVYVVENVYPRIDVLNVEPTRNVIKEVFAEHIIHAPGMEKVSKIVNYRIIPTPAAVMSTTELLYEMYGDCLTIDIGGATTDVDSVTEGSPEVQEMLISPEPIAKRTVEGDLGLYVNAKNVVEMIGKENLSKEFSNLETLIENITPYPKDLEEENFISRLATYCVQQGIRRHAGTKRHLYTPLGRKTVAEGKDLTAVRYVFGTGGFLSRSKLAKKVIESVRNLGKLHTSELLPGEEVKFLRDKGYIFAGIGLIATEIDRNYAKELLKRDLEEY